MMSVSVMAPTPPWMQRTRTLVVGELFQGLLDRLDRALHVGLDDEVEVLDLTGGDLAEQIVQRGLLLGS